MDRRKTDAAAQERKARTRSGGFNPIAYIYPMQLPTNNRYLALDVLRGMTVCFMIIVNTPGSGATPFSPLEHAAWHGFTPTDLVYPTFLFVVGNAMAFTMGKLEALPAGAAVGRILKRTALIFLLGYLMYWFPFFRQTAQGGWELSPISQTRIMGVLQRIAVCYGLAALMLRFLSTRMVWVLSALFLVGYWIILAWGGDYSMTGNIGSRFDEWVMGADHLYHGEGIPFEPEGLISNFTSTVNVIVGYYAGRYIRSKGNGYETVAMLMLTGAGLLAAAYFWNNLFPINKKLWTSSFVLYTCGLSMMILAALIYILEIAGKRGWSGFFEVFGKNPLAIYLLSEILAISLWAIKAPGGRSLYERINDAVFQRLLPGATGSLLFALTVMGICWLAGWVMDRRRIYVRV